MTKVAIFCSSLAGGGMERAMLNLAEYFQSQGAEVDLLVAAAKGSLLEEAQLKFNVIGLSNKRRSALFIRYWLLKSIFSIEPLFAKILLLHKLPKSIKVIPELENYIKQVSPDVIISTPTTSNLAVLWSARSCGFNKKIIIREAITLSREVAVSSSPFYKHIQRLVSKWYNSANSVLCVSEGVYKDLAINFNVKKNKACVIPSIIDVEGIKKQSKVSKYDDLIIKFNPYILAVGRLNKQKDFEFLIKSYAEISNFTSCKLVILGEGDQRDSLERLIEKLNLSRKVFLPGFVANPYPFIKACEVFALSSRFEGLPNVLREAMLLDKKIISTDCPSGVRDILGDGEYGTIVPLGDMKKFSEELLKLIDKHDECFGVVVEKVNDRSKRLYSELVGIS